MILKLGELTPRYESAAFIASTAVVVGDVVLGEKSSVWFGALVRGDVESIRIGDRTNIQDNAILHVADDMPLSIGKDVTIGHGAIIHACTIHDNSLIGMGACVMDGAEILRNCIVGAGSLVPPGKSYPAGSLLVGTPAKVVRDVTEEEIKSLEKRISDYVDSALQFASTAVSLDV